MIIKEGFMEEEKADHIIMNRKDLSRKHYDVSKQYSRGAIIKYKYYDLTGDYIVPGTMLDYSSQNQIKLVLMPSF